VFAALKALNLVTSFDDGRQILWPHRIETGSRIRNDATESIRSNEIPTRHTARSSHILNHSDRGQNTLRPSCDAMQQLLQGADL
jgi:hypothetical protein